MLSDHFSRTRAKTFSLFLAGVLSGLFLGALLYIILQVITNHYSRDYDKEMLAIPRMEQERMVREESKAVIEDIQSFEKQYGFLPYALEEIYGDDSVPQAPLGNKVWGYSRYPGKFEYAKNYNDSNYYYMLYNYNWGGTNIQGMWIYYGSSVYATDAQKRLKLDEWIYEDSAIPGQKPPPAISRDAK